MAVERSTRRTFLMRGAAAGAGLYTLGHSAWGQSRPAGDKLRIAAIGVTNQGGWNLTRIAGEEIVALCDVDETRGGRAHERFPKARLYTDFRKLFDDKNTREFDAVLIAAPDHIHAPATLAALGAGKHVYCEKPLTRTLYEAKKVIDAAADSGLVTQMGTQIHAGDNYRRVVEAIEKGTIGEVAEVEVWFSDRTWSGGKLPAERPPVPADLHWDLWLGPSQARPYSPEYHPAKWRGWWDFGGGTLADMACHFMDLPHWALGLGYPETIEAEGPPVDAYSAPEWRIVRYQYPARGKQPPVKLSWYDGGKLPKQIEEKQIPAWSAGVLFVGSKGMLLSNYERHLILLGPDANAFKRPEPYIPASVGHHQEWINACKGQGKTTCHFGYSGPLTASVLLGNVAYRTGKKIEWDADKWAVTNDVPEAHAIIHPEFRKGWGI